MDDLTVDPTELTTAARSVDAEAATVAGLADHVRPPSAAACGQLLENAFALTFPGATDGGRGFLAAMGWGAGTISDRLAANARAYAATEQEAARQAGTIAEVN